MIQSVLRPFSQFALAAAGGEASGNPSHIAVVFTGISLVFSILAIIWLLLLLEGKLFSWLDAKKAAKQAEATQAAAPKPAAQPTPAPAPAPAVQDGIPPEVVAAITAAVASIDGGKYTLRSVAAAPKGRNQWGLAGVISYTEPF